MMFKNNFSMSHLKYFIFSRIQVNKIQHKKCETYLIFTDIISHESLCIAITDFVLL